MEINNDIDLLCKVYVYILFLFLTQCSNSIQKNRVSFDWEEIYKTTKPVFFSHIDSSLTSCVFSYSYSATKSGGFEIVRLNSSENELGIDILYEHTVNTISFLKVKR